MHMYVLQVVTGAEIKVRRELGLKGYKAFVPCKVITPKNDKLIKPLFPGYVFIELDLSDGDFYRIKSIPLFYRFLGVNRPEPLHEEEKEYILWLENAGAPLGASDIKLKNGQRVEIVGGPLKGHECQVIRVIPRKKRALVAVTICGQPKTISLLINVLGASET